MLLLLPVWVTRESRPHFQETDVSTIVGICICSSTRVSPAALMSPGMDGFFLAKVECHGMTASTGSQAYLPVRVCGCLPVLLHKSGYSTNSHGKFLALHAL